MSNKYLRFSTKSGNKYIHDSATGSVIPLNEPLAEVLELYPSNSAEIITTSLSHKYPSHEIEGAVRFINRWYKSFNGLYQDTNSSSQDETQRVDLSSDVLSQYVYTIRRDQLLLIVTEDCNLRCKYCSYTDSYEHMRSRTAKTMSFETARKAIDYYFKLLKPMAKRIPGRKVAIGFYGGEPLLNRDLIESIIHYANRKAPLDVYYLMTTNATLLNDEAADFIVKNNICLAVSIDGPKINHDRNRVFPDGSGSYDLVMQNITRFFNRYPHYKHISFAISVWDYLTDFTANDLFFNNDCPIKIGFANGVSNTGSTYYNRFTAEEKKRFTINLDRKWQESINKLKNGEELNPYMKNFVSMAYVPIYFRSRISESKPEIMPNISGCIPGSRKLCIRTDGTIDICERVNETLPIGHVDTGIDMEKVRDIIKKFNSATDNKCSTCNNINLCGMCFATCNTDSNYVIDDNECNNIKHHNTRLLSDMYSILEVNESAFRSLFATDELLATAVNRKRIKDMYYS